jgi:hypothetical protein
MLFKILKLFGLDVPAKVAAAKSAIEQRAEEVAGYAKQAMQTAAVIAALSAFAGILGAMAVGVGLYALYRVVAESYGVDAGLGVVAGVLIAAAMVFFLIARTKGAALSQRPLFKPLRSPEPAAASGGHARACAGPFDGVIRGAASSRGLAGAPGFPARAVREDPEAGISHAGRIRRKFAGNGARDHAGGSRAGGQSRAIWR